MHNGGMTPEEVESIEIELKLKLPDDYRRTLLKYPFHTLRGNDFAELFDTASDLIGINRTLVEDTLARVDASLVTPVVRAHQRTIEQLIHA